MVSIIIPTTKGGFIYLTALLPELVKEPDIELIVIDNNSNDGTANYLGQFNCRVIHNNPGKNFSQSNNQGAKIASGEYLLFLNNDTRIVPGLITKMVNTFNLDPQIGVVGSLIFTMDNPKKVQHAGICFNQDYVPYELGLPIEECSPGIISQDPRVKSVREVNSVTAACMMMKKKVWEEVGGFDEGYINGWEDTDLVLRTREKGYKVWYNGNAVIYHHHFGSRSQGRFRFEEQNRGRYDQIWVHSGRARQVIGENREL